MQHTIRIGACVLLVGCMAWVAAGNTKIKGARALGIRFNHDVHQTQPCQSCHPKDTAGRLDDMAMKDCYPCHQKQKRTLSACRTCHLVYPDGRMKTRIRDLVLIPPDWLKGPTHGMDWTGNHARIAGSDSRFCANCHRETDCSDCHAGRRRQKNIHPADWLNAHGQNATMDNPRCMGCHRSQSACLSCHRRAGVAPDSPGNRRGARPARYHGNASPEKICRRARTNIAACASCHSEQSCTTCHTAINPHPVGFSRRCRTLAQKNRRACAKCHTDDVAQRCK
ncbi:MAG: hypothetical protein JXX14_10120 [Deltaproteobacteria bacterium]|nr:hypothetical protein [Deltaproteobacteria bacterium]